MLFGGLVDTYGRKKPAWVMFILASLGWVVLPLGWGGGSVAQAGSLWSGYLISSLLIGFTNNIT